MESQIQNNVLEFNDDVIWEGIITNSDDLEKPNVFQLSENMTSFKNLKHTALSAIKDFMDKPRDLGVIIIYIDGETISDPFRFLSDNPKYASESIEEWKQRILPNKTLVIRIDTSITLSDKLHYAFEEFLRPVFASQGIPLGGVGVSLQFGDHKWSPEGLGEDLTQKKKLAINIGNTDQTIYEWTPEKQKEVGGLVKKKGKVQNFTDYLNNYSKKYTVSKDQIAVMSNQGMFIVEHEGFYYKIQVRLSDLNKKELLSQMMLGLAAVAISANVRGKNVNILPVYNANTHDDFTQEILKDLQYAHNDLNLSMRDLIKNSFKDICYARRSNCGFLGSVPALTHKEVNKKFSDITKDSKIKLKNNKFIVEYYSQNNQTFLFMRGQKTVVKQSKSVTDMIDTLNAGIILTYGELMETNNWHLSAIEKLIQLAYKFRVIEIIIP